MRCSSSTEFGHIIKKDANIAYQRRMSAAFDYYCAHARAWTLYHVARADSFYASYIVGNAKHRFAAYIRVAGCTCARRARVLPAYAQLRVLVQLRPRMMHHAYPHVLPKAFTLHRE